MKCNRRIVFLTELKTDWDKLNLAAKALVFIGGFLFSTIIFVALYKVYCSEIYKTIEVIFRSSLASVFGFILSSNIKNVKPQNIPYVEKYSIKEEDIKEEDIKEDCKEVIEKRYRNEGNSVQIVIAFLVTVISAIVMIIIYVFEITQDVAILSQFRDLMCMSIGFLLGESKIKKND
ncbi:hypothetical protein [Romboutsia sp. 1001713B170207_170306_H8]|uniref:hypothetical protein n=1 Tax=Romboutsia sp. 1001713B170207_170306_H8 TaxID=2787112 RepID=UPI00189A44AD|nr:hypothetical protein [Romboutsia sp. 1001713B170207_170306_H8]